VNVEIRSEHPGGGGLVPRLRVRLPALLAAMGRAGQGVSLLLTDDRRIRALNRRWRGVDRPTDVLSFPAQDPPGSGPELGDVAISLDTAARRARRGGRPHGAEVERYLVHGLLHLAGHDHHGPREARAMAAEEARLLGTDGMVAGALAPAARRGPDALRGARRRR
jgi:probable rRNA maturation factor